MIKTAVMDMAPLIWCCGDPGFRIKAEVAKSAGQEVALKYVLDLRDFPDSPVADKLFTISRSLKKIRKYR